MTVCSPIFILFQTKKQPDTQDAVRIHPKMHSTNKRTPLCLLIILILTPPHIRGARGGGKDTGGDVCEGQGR